MTDTRDLVNAGEVQFDRALESLSMKDLVQVISYLQAEIVMEQANFQTLHHQLAAMTDLRSADSNAAHRRVSQELVECQDRIGNLMQKNIKCFNYSSKIADDSPDDVTDLPPLTTVSSVDASAKVKVVDSIPTGGTVKALRSTVWHQNGGITMPRPQLATTVTSRRSQSSNNETGVSHLNKTECATGANAKTRFLPEGLSDNVYLIEHREVTDISGYGGGDPDDEELVAAFEDRPSLLGWNPVRLLEDLYRIEMDSRAQEELSKHYVLMDGFLEKLPVNTRDNSVLRVWKRRYFRAERGNLFYYKEKHDDKSLGFIQLMGSVVKDAGEKIVKIDDQRGHVLTVRCPTDREHQDWLVALKSQTIDTIPHTYVQPVLHADPHPTRRVLIVDIGGTSVRAGVLATEPSLPDVFFPFVVAINKTTEQLVFGMEAFEPGVRSSSRLVYPMRPSARLDKITISGHILTGLMEKIFSMLNINPDQYMVMLSSGNVLDNASLQVLVTSLLEVHHCPAVCMMYQPVLALYSYSSTLGVVVDIGERCDIVPVIDGYVMSGSSSKQPYGGSTVSERLNQNLAENKHRFYTETEKLFVRLVKEKCCFVSRDHAADMEKFYADRAAFAKTITLSRYDPPANSCSELMVDSGTFHAAEGLFDPEQWGQDTPSVHKATHRVIQQCPMDARKELCRNIYLSGGCTLISGFAERLEAELNSVYRSQSVQIQVHASPYRYHAAYIGACVLASLTDFPAVCIDVNQWREDQAACIRKLQAT